MSCKLCLEDKPLLDSHVFPKFVVKYLRDTAASPYFRSSGNPNKREQDGPKMKLLCSQCEGIFSKFEKIFAEKIYTPYVKNFDSNHDYEKELTFNYDKWLLKFAISVQWRAMFLPQSEEDPHSEKYKIIMEKWRLFLLDLNFNDIPGETNLIFLKKQYIFYLDEEMPVNLYLLRGLDATPINGTSNLKKYSFFSKIGPIAFWTTFYPTSIKGAGTTKIHFKGKLSTSPIILDDDVKNFIFWGRAVQWSKERIEPSEEQKKKIMEDLKKNPDRVNNSHTLGAQKADKLI